MFSIGEFSSASGIPVRTLRFYHEQGLLVPAAVDPQTNYRSYDEQNLERASVIVALRELEFSLDDIREILADADDDVDLLTHLERQKDSLTNKLRHYQDIVARINRFIEEQHRVHEEDQMNVMSFEIDECELEPVLVAGIRMHGAYSDSGQGFATLYKRLGRHIKGKPLCLFYDGEYRDGDANFEPCVPVRKATETDGIFIHELPGGHCVKLIHRGPYQELHRSYGRLMKYVKKHRYETLLPSREAYLKGPGLIFHGNPKKYLTEIQLPVSKP